MNARSFFSTQFPARIAAAWCAALAVILSIPSAPAAQNESAKAADISATQLARDAISESSEVAANAIRSLRARGPDGLRALLETHAEILKQHAQPNIVLGQEPNAVWLRLKTALDEVSRQRDCYASRLYWYTDFDEAKAAARASGRPILSLRLLGKLDEEFSCANSRFFRTTLYANAEVARRLNEYFVLHWKSVRPVPRVTIDFGDGRKLERTITGNSIHYVLDADGRVIDALPGLYGPKAFLRELDRGEVIVRECSKLETTDRDQFLREFHRSRVAALESAFAADLRTVATAGESVDAHVAASPVGYSLSSSPPTAQIAAKQAVGKFQVETKILRATAPTSWPMSSVDDATWQKIAALHNEDAILDGAAKSLMRAKGPNATEAARVALSKGFAETPILRQIRNLERSISEDTVRNEYMFHSKIHEWLANGTAPAQLDALNAKVYAELFLTPDSDPWLGLLSPDAYSALESDGLTVTAKQ